MCVPRNGAVRRVRSQSDPLVAGRTEDAVRLELGDVGVRTKIFNALLLGPLRPAFLGRWSAGFTLRFGRVHDGLSDRCRVGRV